MLMRVFGFAEPEGEASLSDVGQDNWYSSSIAAANKLGIVKGKLDGTFGANEEISRQDMAVMVYRALQALKIDLKSTGQMTTFNDDADVSGYAAEVVRNMQCAAVIEGSGGQFRPKDNATRAQAAVIIYRLLNSWK
jgi:hypothetical protein